MLKALTCPCCGGSVNMNKLECEYCGTKMALAPDGESSNGQCPTKCPVCGCTIFDGTQFCLQCETILKPSPLLTRRAEKVRFSQDKYRQSFIPAVSGAFLKDEFVLADTYGPKEWYVVTTHRLLICRQKISLLSSPKLEGIQKSVDLTKITKLYGLSIWSDEKGNFESMRIETFDGDLDLCFNGSEKNLVGLYFGLFKDPIFWHRSLCEAVQLIEEGKKYPDVILYNLKPQPPSVSSIVAQALPDLTFKFCCPGCGIHLEAEKAWIGMQAECPNCKMSVTI